MSYRVFLGNSIIYGLNMESRTAVGIFFIPIDYGSQFICPVR